MSGTAHPALPRPRRRSATRTWATCLAALSLVGVSPQPALAHPLHTSLAELSYDPATRVLQVSLRVFADDFSAAVTRGSGARTAGTLPPDSAMFRYVAARFAIATSGAGPVPLRWCGARRDGEALRLCLRAADVRPLAGARVRSALLTEVFTDQVNLVQASYGGRRHMLLLTPRTELKTLP